jgi:hypothetical protein
VQIAELTQLENQKFLDEKDRKLRIEIENVRQKQELEISAFQMKMSAAYNEFKKARAVDFDRIIQKYKNKMKEMEQQQKLEINSIVKMSKYNLLNEYFYFLEFSNNNNSSTIMNKSQANFNRSKISFNSKRK